MLEFFGTSPRNILIRCTTLKSSPLAAKPAACVCEWWRIIKYRYEPGLKKVTDRFDMWNYYCRRLHVITIPGPGPTRVEQSSEVNYPIPWTTSLMHDSDRSQKNVISLVIKEAVNITKEETAIRQKKIRTSSYLFYQTERAFSGWTETLSKRQQRWGACSSTAEISF